MLVTLARDRTTSSTCWMDADVCEALGSVSRASTIASAYSHATSKGRCMWCRVFRCVYCVFLLVMFIIRDRNTGSNIARVIATSTTGPKRRVQISSRSPQKVHSSLKASVPADRLLDPFPLDVTKPSTLADAFKGADVVVSLVGIMDGTPQQFEDIQWKGAENVAIAAKNVGAKLVHFSAIGANDESNIPYVRTKGLAEKGVLRICPDATILRPSLVFGPEDDFFNVSMPCTSIPKHLSNHGIARGSPAYLSSYLFSRCLVEAYRASSRYMWMTWPKLSKSLREMTTRSTNW